METDDITVSDDIIKSSASLTYSAGTSTFCQKYLHSKGGCGFGYTSADSSSADDTNGGMSEFQDWVTAAYDANGEDMKLAIKADSDTPYKTIKKMMSELQDMNRNRYYLITSYKTNSED